MERIEIEETQEVDLEMSLDNLINYLNNLKVDGWGGISYGYDNQLVVYRTRLETDAEFDKRLKLMERQKEEEKILKQKKKDRDLKEYLRLKKKFEKEGK